MRFLLHRCRITSPAERKGRSDALRSVGFAIRLPRAMLSSALIVLATAWLAACSSDDLAGDGSGDGTDTTTGTEIAGTLDAISFGGSLSDDEEETTTRATDLEGQSVISFTLYGYKNIYVPHTGLQNVFPGYTVSYKASSANTTTDNTADWYYVDGTSQTIKYWDYSATAYRFMAYAETTEDNGVTQAVSYNNTSTPADTLMTFTFAADGSSTDAAPYVSQLWFSDNSYDSDYPEYGETVVLSFSKPFVRVRIIIVDASGDALVSGSAAASHIDANSISFAPTDESATIATAGSVTVAYPLTGDDTQESYSFSSTTETTITIPYEETGSLVFATEAEKWYTVLPNTEQGSYTFSLTYSNEERTAVVPEAYMQWRAGYQYTYVFKLSANSVIFQPNLYIYTKWQAGYASTATW